MTGSAPSCLSDWAVPPGHQPPWDRGDVAGFPRRASWTPGALRAVTENLAEAGPDTLRTLGPDRLLDAWLQGVESMRPVSPLARQLRPVVAAGTGLSEVGLDAALEVMLAGADGASARPLAEDASERPRHRGLTVIVLASNVPALAVQALLPALALGGPVLVKSPRAEPFWTASFINALVAAEPALAEAVAAVCWPGGDRAIEDRVFQHADRVLAYGGASTIGDLAPRLGARLMAYGPKISVALVGRDADPVVVAGGLARDIALFDQRGCLSVQAVYTAGEASFLADALAVALEGIARELPPGPVAPATAAAVHRLRATAAMRGHHVASLPMASGTVVVDPDPVFRPSPGARTVRIHPVRKLDDTLAHLEPCRAHLQGAVLAGGTAWALEPGLTRLGVSRCADPGRLQDVDLSWQNGGVSLLDVLSD